MKARFAAAYVICALLGFAAVVAFAGQLKQGTHRPAQRPRTHAGCSSVNCAQLGDHVSYVLDGQVTQVSSPQAGVICLQVQSRTHGGDYCALAH